MKRTLFILAVAALALGCKKSKTAPQFDLTGTWVLSSSSVNNNTYLASDFPCMSNEIVVFQPNGNLIYKWHDTATCWIDQAHTVSLNMPGSDSSIINYVRNGNQLLFPATPPAHPGYGQVSSVNGKLQLLWRDTNIYKASNFTDTFRTSALYIKQ